MTAWAADQLRRSAEHSRDRLKERRYESDEARQLQAEVLTLLEAELEVLRRLRIPPPYDRRRRRTSDF